MAGECYWEIPVCADCTARARDVGPGGIGGHVCALCGSTNIRWAKVAEQDTSHRERYREALERIANSYIVTTQPNSEYSDRYVDLGQFEDLKAIARAALSTEREDPK